MMLMRAYLVWLYGMRWHCCNWLSRDASASSNSTGKHSGSKKRSCHAPPCDEVIVAKPKACPDCNGLAVLPQQKIDKSAKEANKNRDRSCILYITCCSIGLAYSSVVYMVP